MTWAGLFCQRWRFPTVKCWLCSFGVKWWTVIWLRTQLDGLLGTNLSFPDFDQALPAVKYCNKRDWPRAYACKSTHQSYSTWNAMTSIAAPCMTAHMQSPISPTSPTCPHIHIPIWITHKHNNTQNACVFFIRLAADTVERYDPLIVKLFNAFHQLSSVAAPVTAFPDCKALITGRTHRSLCRWELPKQGLLFL